MKNITFRVDNQYSRVKNQSLVDAYGQVTMFTPIAKTMTEVRHEQNKQSNKMQKKAIELADGRTSVY